MDRQKKTPATNTWIAKNNTSKEYLDRKNKTSPNT
jgi:hypothetical protein